VPKVPHLTLSGGNGFVQAAEVDEIHAKSFPRVQHTTGLSVMRLLSDTKSTPRGSMDRPPVSRARRGGLRNIPGSKRAVKKVLMISTLDASDAVQIGNADQSRYAPIHLATT
jgi:hypothetical protein